MSSNCWNYWDKGQGCSEGRPFGNVLHPGDERHSQLFVYFERRSNEFKHFQKMTMTPTVEGKKNVVIMGRKTWFSIPEQNRPLKNRINVVLSRELKTAPEGAHYLAPDFSSALRLLENPELEAQADQVWIIGGSSLYKEAMESSGRRRLFVTRILKQFDCDTFIPDIDPDKFKLLPEFPGVPAGLQEEKGL
ncbi:dihydrofolate reductase, partial [Clarias magur]